MRIGDNPNKFSSEKVKRFVHQVIVPVYIPHEEGYFKDAFQIFQLCIQSLIATTNPDTYITIVNNGSGNVVVEYLDNLFKAEIINELIHSSNIGKINAVLKGLAGVNAEIVTVSDQDILFQENWQTETFAVFNTFPKAGFVGIIPMFRLHEGYAQNVILDYLFSDKLKFRKVKNAAAMIKFYDSIWKDRNYNPNYLKMILTISSNTGKIAIVGSGHLVASFRKNIFNSLETIFTEDLLSGKSDGEFLDLPSQKLGYYRLTTYDNYAYHMGNVYEKWMDKYLPNEKKQNDNKSICINESRNVKKSLYTKISYFVKYVIVKKIIFSKLCYSSFLKYKSLK